MSAASSSGIRWRFASALTEAAAVIESTKPRTALFGAYADEDRRELRIVHVFPDPAAMTAHFEGSDERTQSVAHILTPVSFEVYGDAPAEAMAILRREAANAGGSVGAWTHGVSGFIRAPA